MIALSNVSRPLRMAAAALFFYEAAQILQVQVGQWAWIMGILFMIISLAGLVSALRRPGGAADTSLLSVFNSLLLAAMIGGLAAWHLITAGGEGMPLVKIPLYALMIFFCLHDALQVLRLRRGQAAL